MVAVVQRVYSRQGNFDIMDGPRPGYYELNGYYFPLEVVLKELGYDVIGQNVFCGRWMTRSEYLEKPASEGYKWFPAEYPNWEDSEGLNVYDYPALHEQLKAMGIQDAGIF